MIERLETFKIDKDDPDFTPLEILAESFGFTTDLPKVYSILESILDLKKNFQSLGCTDPLITRALTDLDSVSKQLQDYLLQHCTSLFSQKLEALIKKHSTNITSLADYLFLTEAQLEEIIEGKKLPNIPQLCLISSFFGCSVDFLVRPDALETNLNDSIMYRIYGITSESCAKLRLMQNTTDNPVMNTLNTLICNYEKNYTDLLYAITEYLKNPMSTSLHVISDEALGNLTLDTMDENDAEALKDIIDKFTANVINDNAFIFNGAPYEADKALLLVIQEILVNLKNKKIQS